MTKYQKRQDEVRQQAIDWQQCEWNDEKEFMEKTWYFYTMGKRYGLLREFQENGII